MYGYSDSSNGDLFRKLLKLFSHNRSQFLGLNFVIFGSMKKIIFLLFVLLEQISFGQKVAPFVDFNNYFRTFENDNFRQLELQPIKEFKAGDDLIAYIDTRGNLRVYDGKERKDISNMNIQYKISDHLLAYNIGSTLNMWDEGKLRTLTYFGRNYEVKDSSGAVIGKVTSGTQSPSLNKAIGMGYVTIDNSKVGSEIFIEIREKQLKAIVSKVPFL